MKLKCTGWSGLLRLSSLWVVSAAFAQQNAPTIDIAAVTNSADFQPGLPQPGSLGSVFVTGLQGAPGIITAANLPLPTELAGVRVWINSIAAPILAVAFFNGYQQINIQVPWEVPEAQNSTLTVTQNGAPTQSNAPLASKLSVFFADAKGYGVFQHAADYSRVAPDNPVRPGEYVLGYGINLGPVSHTPATGAAAPFDPLALSIVEPPVCVMTDSIQFGATDRATVASASPSFVGLAPGTVGIYQVNFQVPQSVTPGDLPISFARNLQEDPLGCPGIPSQISLFTETSLSVLLPVR